MRNHKDLLYIILIPTFLGHLGNSVGTSFVPLYAANLGASLALAALIPALQFIGQALADIPAACLIIRFGKRRIMILGNLLLFLAMLLRILNNQMVAFVTSILLSGIGLSLTWLSRMSWMKERVRGEQRGYAMSFVGGAMRLALIIGPLIGGYITEYFGYKVLFSIQGILHGIVLIFIILQGPAPGRDKTSFAKSLKQMQGTWNRNHQNILPAMLGISGLSILRVSRGILFPLWGYQLGLSESRVGLMMFIGALVDASLFWLSGLIMTRLGRKFSAVLCTATLALAIGFLPLAGSFAALVTLSILAGLGNASGAGLNLTVSNDLAPRGSPEFFLSIWRCIQGMAGFGGPALTAWMISQIGSGNAPPLSAAMGFAAALILVIFMKETR